LTISTFEEQ